MARRDSKMVQAGAWGALAAGAALVIKVAQIFATDGADHPIQAVLYIGGILLGILGAAGVGSYYGSTTPKKVGLGVGTFLLFLVFMMGLSDGIGSLVAAVTDGPAYVADEVPIALVGLAWLFVGYRLMKGSDTTNRMTPRT